MSSTNAIHRNFTKGFAKTASLPKWLHEMPHCKAKIEGHSRKGLAALLKRRGIK